MPLSPTAVTGSGSPPSGSAVTTVAPVVGAVATTTVAVTPANAAYKTGNGVVLSPISMQDAATGSEIGFIGHANITSDVVKGIKASNPDVCVPIWFEQPPNSFVSFVRAFFRKLPPGNHSYMLTAGLSGVAGDPSSVEDYFYITVDNKTFKKGNMAFNPATSETRVVFTYDPGAVAGRTWLEVHLMRTQPKFNVSYYFHHLQLVQLD